MSDTTIIILLLVGVGLFFAYQKGWLSGPAQTSITVQTNAPAKEKAGAFEKVGEGLDSLKSGIKSLI